jgi:radical SAM protein with 4Fe4S-binding SPASM domain
MTSEIKPVYGIERTHLASLIPLPTPFSIYVFPSTYCNFKCIYCAHSLRPEELNEKYGLERRHMSLETYHRIIAQIAEFPHRLKLLSLTGQGEAMMNKNIAEMVRIAKNAQVAERIEIISNGRLLSQEMADSLIDAGLDILRISLQGLNSDKYQEVAGVKVNFDEFHANLRYFFNKRKNTKLYVKIMDVALEANEEEKFYAMFRNCSDRMYIEKMLPTYAGVPLTDTMPQADYDRQGRKIMPRNVCPLPFYMLSVFPEGDVEPCDTLYKPVVLGNIHNERLIEMWRGEKLHRFWLQQLQGERKDNPKCAVCCAPNDVAHPEDVLDENTADIIQRLSKHGEKIA